MPSRLVLSFSTPLPSTKATSPSPSKPPPINPTNPPSGYPFIGKVSSLLSPSPHKLPPMESLSKTHHKSLKKAKKAKREPIKVVYISNPMRVVATAAEFRARVQELTGRDSDITATADDYSTVAPAPVAEAAYNPVAGADRGADLYRTVANPFEMFDEAFTSRVLEGFHGFMPSSRFYESPPIGAFRGLDQV